MKRELAFASEARSQFGCFTGRTRSSDSPVPQFTDSNRKSKNRSFVAKSIDEVHVNRRSKRVKTTIPDGNEKSTVAEVRKGRDEAEAADVVNRDGKSLAMVVFNGGDDSSPVVEVANSEKKGRGLVKKVDMKLKKSKNQVIGSTPKRFTRSALKDSPPAQFTDSNRKGKDPLLVDRSAKSIDEGHVNRRKKRVKTMVPDGDSVNAVESKGNEELAEAEVQKGGDEAGVANGDDTSMAKEVFTGGDRSAAVVAVAKKIGLSKMPTNMRELLETGLLEGFRVYYNFKPEVEKLVGQIKGVGILCSCNLCQDTKVISLSQFEMHACKSYRRAIKHIYLENGKSLFELIEICKAAAPETLDVALQTVFSSLPSKATSICRNCNSSFDSSTENLLICDSCLNGIQLEAEPTVASRGSLRKLSRASSPEPKASESNRLAISSDKKTKRRRKRRRLSELIQRSAKSAGNHTLKRDKIKSRPVKRSRRSTKSVTKRNPQLHSAIFEKGGLPDGTELTYVSQGKTVLDGYKRGNGIFCSCCKNEISASQFEVHAGWTARRKPYEKIYIKNGVSLHEYALSMKVKDMESKDTTVA